MNELDQLRKEIDPKTTKWSDLSDEMKDKLMPYLKKFTTREYWKEVLELSDEDDWNLYISPRDCQNENFSSIIDDTICCDYNKQVLLSQEVLNQKYKTGIDICILTSLFNAYPKLFYNNPKNIRKYRYNKLGKDYNNANQVIDFFNKKFGKNILSYNQYDLNKLKDSLLHNKPVILCRHDFCSSTFEPGHAVSVYGLDKDYLYYFENGLSDTLYRSLSLALLQKLFDWSINTSKLEKQSLTRVLTSLNISDLYDDICLNRVLFIFENSLTSKFYVKKLEKRLKNLNNDSMFSSIRRDFLIVFSQLNCIYIDQILNWSITNDQINKSIYTNRFKKTIDLNFTYDQDHVDFDTYIKNLDFNSL